MTVHLRTHDRRLDEDRRWQAVSLQGDRHTLLDALRADGWTPSERAEIAYLFRRGRWKNDVAEELASPLRNGERIEIILG